MRTCSDSPSTVCVSTEPEPKRLHSSASSLLDELGVVAVGGERGDQRDRAPVGAAAAEQPDAVALQREQRDDGAAQVVGARREQLVLREGVEQRDRGLVVVRALDQVLVAEDLAQLAVEQRRLRGGLGVGLAREQAEHPRLARDAAVRPDLADADVVHAGAPVDRREPVRLRDDQQVALERALADLVPAGRPAAAGARRRTTPRRRGSRARSRGRRRACRPRSGTRGSRGR